MRITKTQRQALTNARDFGDCWNYRAPQVGGFTMPWSASKSRMHRVLEQAGLLKNDKITEAGRAALAAE